MKRVNWFLVVGILLGGALLVSAVSLYLVQQQRIDAQHARIVADAQSEAELQQQYQGLVGQYTEAYGQLEQSGVKPTTAPPSTLPAAQGSPGAAGARGTDGRDGRGVAFALCTATGWSVTYTDGDTENAGTCIGTDGPPGVAGTAGTSGKDGTNGIDGQPGANGADGATGAQGPQGAPGATGATGTGVASVTCATTEDGASVFRFTLTDGTTQDVPGDCTAPTPTPDPSPAG